MTEPLTLTLQLDLDSYLVRYVGLDSEGEQITERQTLEDVLIDRASQALATGVSREDKSRLSQMANRIREEEIRVRVIPIIEEALSVPFRKTNAYGELTGDATTLREVIVKTATDYLTKPADNYNRDRGNVVQSFIAAEVRKAVDAELRVALDQAKAEVKAAVAGQAANVIQETIIKMAGVR